MASLQARHSRRCGVERAWTSFREATEGCSCPDGPLYYVVVREDGRSDKIRVGRNCRQAERALRKIAVTVDDGEYQPQPNIPFSEWADRWLSSLELKQTTVKSYAPTMNYAKAAFRRKPVRRLRTEDVARFNSLLRRRPSPAPHTPHGGGEADPDGCGDHTRAPCGCNHRAARSSDRRRLLNTACCPGAVLAREDS